MYLAMTTQDLKREIIYRSKRRGLKELDIVLSTFVAKHLEELTPDEQVTLRDLLLELEADLQKWLVDHQPGPAHYQPMLQKILG